MTQSSDAKPVDTPPYRLYRLPSIALASFLGTPLAGGWLMAVNSWRAGHRSMAARAVLGSALVTAMLMGIALLLPRNMPRTWLVVPGVVCMYHWARVRQGEILDRHAEAGGTGETWVKAMCVGLLGTTLLAATVIGWQWRADPPWRDVEFGPAEVIRCRGKATPADANTLGEQLKKLGVFGSPGAKVVLLERSADHVVISIIIEPGKAADEKAKLFAGVVAAHAKLALKAPGVVVRLVHPDLQIQAEVPAE